MGEKKKKKHLKEAGGRGTPYLEKVNKRITLNFSSDGVPCWLRWSRVCLQCKKPGFDLWVRKIPWRKKWQPTPIFLPGKSIGQRSLADYSPWGHKSTDTTYRLNNNNKAE